MTEVLSAHAFPTSEEVRKALGLWHKGAAFGSPLADLLLVRQATVATGGNLRLATNQVLLQALAELEANHADEAELLRARYLDADTVHLLAVRRNVAEATIYFQQHRAIDLLTHIIKEMEVSARAERRSALEDRLPQPTYTKLVGVEHQIDHLIRLVTSPGAPRLIMLDGIGGIGKSSLADALLRALIAQDSFATVAWISAQRQYFHLDGTLRQIPRPALTTDAFIDELAELLLPAQSQEKNKSQQLAALQRCLVQAAHLVVLDNLEMMADAERLLSMLQRFEGQSRFLLISRHSFYAEPGIYHLRVPELAEADALYLVRQEARQRNLPEIATASDSALQPIHGIAGGNPLALRLIVGQAHVHPLSMILADLGAARGETIESLYIYIYRRSWECLDEMCRRALLAMPLVSEQGGDLELLQEISQLRPEILRQALTSLVNLNLVDSQGDLQHRRYTIHNLTRSFLLEQVVRWQV
jgi:hypothetical protein